MAVKHEIKSQLAKLLATEDLIVEHRNVDTAQFEVRSRVLTLPRWEKASNGVYDALVAHEVGHALFTPDRDWFLEFQIPPQFVNVVEDVRIEKLMKRRYLGIAKSFYRGYNELYDQDFFEVEGEDITTFNLADRVNLYYKVGSFLPISFSSIEKPIVDLINNCETFDDTLSAAEVLYNFCKEDQKKQERAQSSDVNGELNGSSDGSSEEMSDEELLKQLESEIDESGFDSVEPEEGESYGGTASAQDDIEVHTLNKLEDALKDLTDTRNNLENVYVELPKLDLKNIIIPNEEIHNKCNIEWDEFIDEFEIFSYTDIFGEVDQEFNKFKKSAQKEVNYLVKEFECRKAADNYARATTSRTGILSTEKLHTYRFNEDLFKKVTTIPDGKNHGLIFILDWSGSMSDVMLDTIKQLYNLLWFCKKVNIPFEVYAFTQEYPSLEGTIHRSAYKKKHGLVLIDETFSLMNLFTSKTNGKILEDQMKNIFRLAYRLDRRENRQYPVPTGLGLSGTPLNESLVALHQIIPQFQKQNKLQKVQCVILTDGESAPLRYSREIQRHWEQEPFMGSQYIHDHCVVRNRKTGHTYSCNGLGHWADVTDLLLLDLRQSFPQINFIGIRVLANRYAAQLIRRYAGYEGESYDKIHKRWKKDKSFTIKNSGYHSYFGLSSNALANDDEFDVEEDATKAQIKRAFVKSLKIKKMNKKILGEFIELVA